MKKRKDGRYVKKVDGKYFYGASEREINRKILNHIEKKESGPLFTEVSAEWWDVEVEKLSPSTVRGYKKATERAEDFFKNSFIREITAADITKYLHRLANKNYAKKTVKNHKIILSRIMHFAAVEGYISHNPTRDAETPRNLSEKKRTAAPPQEEQTIKTADDVWLLPYMAIMTGMRKGELIGLKWGDIDLDANLIHVNRSVWYGGGTHEKEPKTEAGIRMIPILAPLRERLEEQAKEANPAHYVFGDEKPLSEKAFRYRYARFQKQTGIKSTLHQLRKSFATMAVGADVPADVLQVIIGHKDISTTLNIYNEVRAERIAAAGDAMSAFDKAYNSKKQ